MKRRSHQSGAALMAMLAVLILGAAWWTVTVVSTPINRTALDRTHNARILQEAKSALIGHVAHRAAMTTENDPGRLPCPEAAGNIGTANEGIAAGNCALPAVGRLPWRTLGLDKWRDIAGEPLWYVVSAGWTKPNAVTNTVINSNSTGQLTLDGTGDIVALIIAPGRPLQVAAAAGCNARVQSRTTPSPAIDFRDYLECENATSPANAAFQSAGPGDSFNDQVLSITGAEILPGIEAAVASRFERTVAPLLRSAYSNSDAVNPNPNWPNTPLLPFATPFSDPAASNYKGTAGTMQGLLPLTYSTNPADGTACNVADARCDPAFVAWRASPPATAPAVSGATVVAGFTNCTSTTTVVTCNFRASYPVLAPNITVTITHRADNLGMALRQFDTAVAMGGMNAGGRTASGVIYADGSADLAMTGTLPQPVGANVIADLLCNILAPLAQLLNDCGNYTVTVPIGLMADHPLIQDSAATNPQHWFFRNNWHQVSYYAVAPDVAPSGPRACGANCFTLSFNNPPTGHRGLLAIAGRSLAGQSRPPAVVTDWLEGANSDGNLSFAVRDPALMIRRTFNDRIAVIDP